MDEQLKCLHCGHEYKVKTEPNDPVRERVCPKCQSNSVRKISSRE